MKSRPLFLVLGIALGFGGTTWSGCAPCPDTAPADDYVFDGALSDSWVEESGRIEVSDTELRITYRTTDGSRWEVVYARVDE